MTYEEAPGRHNWEFWDTYIAKVLEWLIVKAGSAHFNAGSLFILISVLCYALPVMVTRALRTTESSAMMVNIPLPRTVANLPM